MLQLQQVLNLQKYLSKANKKNSLGLINGKLERALSGIDFGIGIRIINKDRMVYVYTNKKDRESLINLAKMGLQQ